MSVVSQSSSADDESKSASNGLCTIARRDLGMFLGDPTNIYTLYRHFTQLIQLLAQALALPSPIWARAVVLFRRLYLQTTFSASDPRITAPILLLVSAKSLHHMRFSTSDLVTVLKSLEPRHPWPFKSEDLLIEEFHVLQHLNFDLDVPLAYDSLAKLLEPIAIQAGLSRLPSNEARAGVLCGIEAAAKSPLGSEWCETFLLTTSGPELDDLCQRALNALNDIYLRTWLPLSHKPGHLAAAAMYIALQKLKESDETKSHANAFLNAVCRAATSTKSQDWHSNVLTIVKHLSSIVTLERGIDDGISETLPTPDYEKSLSLPSFTTTRGASHDHSSCLMSKLHLVSDPQLEKLMQAYCTQIVQVLHEHALSNPLPKHISYQLAKQICHVGGDQDTSEPSVSSSASMHLRGIVLTLGDLHRILNVLTRQKQERQNAKE